MRYAARLLPGSVAAAVAASAGPAAALTAAAVAAALTAAVAAAAAAAVGAARAAAAVAAQKKGGRRPAVAAAAAAVAAAARRAAAPPRGLRSSGPHLVLFFDNATSAPPNGVGVSGACKKLLSDETITTLGVQKLGCMWRTAAELRVSLGCGVGGTLRDGGFFSASQAECAPPKLGTPIAIAEGVIAPVGHTCDSAPCAIVEQGGPALEAPSSYDAPTASLVAPAALGARPPPANASTAAARRRRRRTRCATRGRPPTAGRT